MHEYVMDVSDTIVWQANAELSWLVVPRLLLYVLNILGLDIWVQLSGAAAGEGNHICTECRQLAEGKKRVLESFYGIGPNVSRRIMAKYYIHEAAKVGSLGNQQVLDLGAELSTMTIGNGFRMQIVENITRLRDLGTYRGRRHATRLPVRGQNTKSQIKTAKKLNKVDRK